MAAPCTPGPVADEIIFDTKTEDSLNLYNTSTGQLSLPAGIWQINASVSILDGPGITPPANSGIGVALAIYKNGIPFMAGTLTRTGAGPTSTGGTVSALVRSSGSDNFSIWLDNENCIGPGELWATWWRPSQNVYMQAVQVGN
jgi:hypothetical protein